MLSLLRQPFIKSVKIAQFAVKNFSQPIPKVLQRSYGSYGISQRQAEPYTKHHHVTMQQCNFHRTFVAWLLLMFFLIHIIPDKKSNQKSTEQKSIEQKSINKNVNTIYIHNGRIDINQKKDKLTVEIHLNV
ncbi:uncharacterized protein LOC122849009 [Aphidius gifuensis]|uniref:uncharacterized protein LOC122849009 n=1 Tax=Aphidius gifuensis TaxID=684658 RepID=UPI001CDD7E18|nr:uncharacterized protein LOC122849009 [Aphidius gifuensis]